MSTIKGINFVKQRLLPSDFGHLLKPLYKDGIVYGCTLEISGSTLQMLPGIMIAGGKGLRLDAPERWIINGASTGYARILLTIDLSRTATKDIFDQVQTTIEYASIQDGFAPLQQGDINGADTIYQVPLAVVQLSARGIESIVQQLPDACNISTPPTAEDFAGNFAPLYSYGTSGMIPGSSGLATGTLYIQYE